MERQNPVNILEERDETDVKLQRDHEMIIRIENWRMAMLEIETIIIVIINKKE